MKTAPPLALLNADELTLAAIGIPEDQCRALGQRVLKDRFKCQRFANDLCLFGQQVTKTGDAA